MLIEQLATAQLELEQVGRTRRVFDKSKAIIHAYMQGKAALVDAQREASADVARALRSRVDELENS